MLTEFGQFLSEISVGFVGRDVQKWRRWLILPFSIVTRDGPIPMATEAEVEQNSHHYLTASKIMQLDWIDRHPVGLEDCYDGTWLGPFKLGYSLKIVLPWNPIHPQLCFSCSTVNFDVCDAQRERTQ